MSECEHDNTAGADEFYVGYLSMPSGLARRTRRTVALIAVLVIMSAVAIALAMRDPGNGVWDTDQVVTITGTYRASPYPLIQTSGPAGKPALVLLVEEGKHGGRQAESVLDGRRVSAKGHVLRRANLTLLELLPSDDAITAEDPTTGPPSNVTTTKTQRATLRGEILDPKCFAGAMKPGDGKAHKGCAVLCLRGGIPPVFAAWSTEGEAMFYLLAQRDGSGFRHTMLNAIEPFVADWVEATGEIDQSHGTPVLRLDTDSLRRAD